MVHARNQKKHVAPSDGSWHSGAMTRTREYGTDQNVVEVMYPRVKWYARKNDNDPRWRVDGYVGTKWVVQITQDQNHTPLYDYQAKELAGVLNSTRRSR